MSKKNHIYLVGNAHLDPVWQWRWQEGSAEAKATIRSALDRMNEFLEFKFVCSSSSIFMWIEEFCPEMFEEIKERVKEGRFVIVGGWHVQPDCNLPAGEGFARQSLYSQRYFKEKFGVTAKVGYNVDSFGHNLMIPQILRKSGMTDYIFMRPGYTENPIESDIFKWVSPDGSSVNVFRIFSEYCFMFDTLEKFDERIKTLEEEQKLSLDYTPLFYGVGNHGGGPTIRNLEIIEEYKKSHPEIELTYSNLSDFFGRLRDENVELPELHDDLQHHASGCYSTLLPVKNSVRRSETSLIAAESFSYLANVLCNKPVKTERIKEAWQNVCFMHFHDTLGGCCIKEAQDDGFYITGAALNTAAVEENNALQTISWNINTEENKHHGMPIVFFNPHGFDVNTTVQLNQQNTGVVDANGNKIPMQYVRSKTAACYDRNDVLIPVSVPALGYAVYYTKPTGQWDKAINEQPSIGNLKAYIEKATFENFLCRNDTAAVLENDILKITFDLHTGYIKSIFNKEAKKENITDDAAVPTVIDEYEHDTWSHGKDYFTNVCGTFGEAKITVIEEGPVRATIKVVSKYNKSTLTQYFSLTEGSDKLSVRAMVDWHEKHKMLKLKWPMAVEKPDAYYEIPFGVIKRPANGEEEPGLMWTAVKGNNGGFAILNDKTYSSSVKDSTIYHTIVRSPIYGDHGGPRTDECIYTDQGEHEFSYVLMPCGDDFAPVIKEAKLLNKPVTTIMDTWHDGKFNADTFKGIEISQDNIMLSAIKRSEDGFGTVIRLYETDGKNTEVTVSGAVMPATLKVNFTPYSVKTFYIKDNETEWQEVLFTEYAE